MKRISSIFLLIFSLLIFSSCNTRGNSFGQSSININNKYSIKITAYHEDCFGPVCGAYYVFESVDLNTDSLREIFTFRHDDPIEIQTENLKVINKDIAYIWMGWNFAVTSDGGETWSIWDATDYEEFDINYKLIEKVEIDKNGRGKMSFNKTAREKKGNTFLITQDFGKTWQKP